MEVYRVADKKKPFYIQDFIQADHLIIPVSSYGQNFEWFKTLRRYRDDYNFSVFWVIDLEKAYWHGGFPGIEGHGIRVISKFIANKIKESKAKKVLLLGFSMGGYGSIAMGCLCNVDMVISFSAQTWLMERRRKKYNLYKKWEGLDVREEDIDLKHLLERYNKDNKTIYKLCFGKTNKHDKAYAEYLAEQRGVELHPINTHRHNSVRPGINTGMLRNFLEEFFS